MSVYLSVLLSAYICLYVCMTVCCNNVCVCVCVCVCVYVCVSLSIYIYIVPSCVREYVRVCVSACVHVFSCDCPFIMTLIKEHGRLFQIKSYAFSVLRSSRSIPIITYDSALYSYDYLFLPVLVVVQNERIAPINDPAE